MFIIKIQYNIIKPLLGIYLLRIICIIKKLLNIVFYAVAQEITILIFCYCRVFLTMYKGNIRYWSSIAAAI